MEEKTIHKIDSKPNKAICEGEDCLEVVPRKGRKCPRCVQRDARKRNFEKQRERKKNKPIDFSKKIKNKRQNRSDDFGSWVDRLDEAFATFVKVRDYENGKFTCISCLLTFNEITEVDCGHYFVRRFNSVRFDLRNINSQCHKCNRIDSGNLQAYKPRLILKIGMEEFRKLEELKKEVRKFSIPELKEMLKNILIETGRMAKKKKLYL